MPSTNDRAAFNFLTAKGLTDFQAAAIIGNLDQESGMNPTAVQSPGPGRGIGQWSLGERWAQAQAYAAQTGQDVWSLNLQLEFLWHELTTVPAYGLADLKATSSVSEATTVFQDKFERCGACNTPRRLALAEAALAAFGSPGSSVSKKVLLVLGCLALGASGVFAYNAVEQHKAHGTWPWPLNKLPAMRAPVRRLRRA